MPFLWIVKSFRHTKLSLTPSISNAELVLSGDGDGDGKENGSSKVKLNPD